MTGRTGAAPEAETAPGADALAEARAGAVLEIDLGAIAGNYRRLAGQAGRAECAGVVKADGYGLGAVPVGRTLAAAGCRTLFVAHLAEGLALRDALPPDLRIAVLHGIPPGTAAEFAARDLLPVLNALGEMAEWTALARALGRRLPAMLQVDTGMARFGLGEDDLSWIDPEFWRVVEPVLLMSHLACADEPAHPANAAQHDAFARLRARLPAMPASLAASSGIFLGPAFHHDLVRPGAALYGVSPRPGEPNPMSGVVRLRARVAQLRTVPAGTPVGYGWTARTAGPSRLATLSVGYADGWLRSLSNRGAATHDGTRLPIVGRVSMDSIVVDASALADGALGPGALVDLLGPDLPVDAVAAAAGTIGYELLTSLGARYHRRHLPA